MGPNPRDGEITGELIGELITEKGEPKMLVGLLEAELLGCCEDMASKLPNEEDDVLTVNQMHHRRIVENAFTILAVIR